MTPLKGQITVFLPEMSDLSENFSRSKTAQPIFLFVLKNFGLKIIKFEIATAQVSFNMILRSCDWIVKYLAN
jgi:hypothetical protein